MGLAQGAAGEQETADAPVDAAEVQVELLVDLLADAAGPDGHTGAGEQGRNAAAHVQRIGLAVEGGALATNHTGGAADMVEATADVGAATAQSSAETLALHCLLVSKALLGVS